MNHHLDGTSHPKPRRTDDVAAATISLREVILAGERYRLAAASRLGLTISESQAVSLLFSRGALGQSELAEAMDMTTGTITALIDRLEQRGYALRTPHPTDRRRIVVSLHEDVSGALHEVRDWLDAAFDTIPDEHLAQLAVDMRAVADRLRDHLRTVPTETVDGSAPPRRRR